MKNKKVIEKKEKVKYFDYYLVGVIIVLLGFGFVMLYSASSYTASMRHGSAMFFLKRQCKNTIIGLIFMLLVSMIDYHKFLKRIAPIYFGTLFLCIYVIINGKSFNNSARWIGAFGFNFQPSELAKVAVILINSYLISKVTFRNKQRNMRLKQLLMCFIPAMVLFVLVALSNLSTAIIIFMITFAMFYIAYPKSSIFILLGGGFVALGSLFIMLESYRSTRMKIWLHPEDYKEGYQTMQGLYAIGSGGPIGKGLGTSLQKKFVPEAQNDMIFTLICEELGVVGALFVIVLFLLLLWRLFIIARKSEDKSGSFIAAGILIHIALQVILNIAVATNSMPNTGVTLPFISYGGSSIFFLLGELGIALNVSKVADFEDR